MPDMRLLLDLQILDQELMSAFNRLGLIDDALEDRHELIQLENRIAENKRFNEKMTVEHKDLELKSMSLKEKANKVENRLYGGSVFNPRELGDLNQELGGLNKDIGTLDERILEMMLNFDVLQERIGEYERKLAEANVVWTSEHEKLVKEKQDLTNVVSLLTDQREKMVQVANPKGLMVYERLRIGKINNPVAEVLRNICGVCRVSLPTHHVQLAKGGKDPILCTSCGRILYAL